MRFGEFIKEKRKSSGITQVSIAKRLNISPAAYCRLENGGKAYLGLNFDQIQELSEILRVNYLLLCACAERFPPDIAQLIIAFPEFRIALHKFMETWSV